MGNMQEILKRTNLKTLGAYLLDTSYVVENVPQEEFSEELLLDRARSDLEIVLDRAGVSDRKEILETVEAMADLEKKAGFYKGMRAGARLLLSLIGEEEELR